MIKQRKVSKLKKTIAIYLAMMILLETLQPMQLYALTGGPSQPEFEAFTPIGTSDMVDLGSGDFNYNIPIMDVGGYPINLAYNSGVTMDQEASWVGLGWNLDVGQITRQLRGLPDDFNGDEMIYENNLKPNVTIGSNVNVFATGFAVKEGDPPKPLSVKPTIGLGIKYNNYDGVGVSSSAGLSYQISDNLSVGMNITSSASEGVSVSPTASFSTKISKNKNSDTNLGLNLGVNYNSRKGVENMTMSSSLSQVETSKNKNGKYDQDSNQLTSGSVSFINTSFTPTKRVGMYSANYMFSVNIEGELWGLEGGAKFSGYVTSQGIKDSEKYKIEKAYGFENTYNAGKSDILDYNREKDRTFNKNTTSLPITNNTYDLYTIQGQGISGMYRPYKSQVGYVYDNETTDASSGGSLGLEFGAGGGVHFGVDATVTLGKSSSLIWEKSNPALGRFKEKKSGNRPDYEKVFFKNIGGNHVDQELNLLKTNLGGYSPIKLNIEGGKFSRQTSQKYYADNNTTALEGNSSIIRTNRLSRNQSIQKLTRVEALNYGSSKNKLYNNISPFSLRGKHDHHTSEIKITKDGGERYIYGRAAYNIVKKETTFDVGLAKIVDYRDGLVTYKGDDNSVKNDQDGDKYFNRITTPEYAHSYLLTSVLSSDYQDLTNDGPSDDDLGSYTRFEYENKTPDRAHTYKWRVPFKKNTANYDEGLRSSKKDNKGNYIYGEKELLYVKKIVTKTHVAIFTLSERNDGYGVADENGGLSENSKMFKLDKISLYSKPEYDAKGDEATPIKEAHFEYNYNLCQNIDNNKNKDVAGPDLENEKGKLTLSKVYFTYKKSKMGKFTPYVFNYAPKALSEKTDYNLAKDNINNPKYDMKAYDVWGSYKKPNSKINGETLGDLPNAEYPFVDQTDRETADIYASAWLLKTIQLPSGGKIEVNFEADDYAFVQDKQAMQMFKVVGSGDRIPNNLDNINDDIKKTSLGKYIYVEIDKNLNINDTDALNKFESTYLKSIGTEDNPLYFRFLLNMVNPNPLAGGSTDKFDYVTGYLMKDTSAGVSCGFFEKEGKKYASIPIRYVGKGDGFNSDSEVNPISKAGWNFGRQHLNRLMYSMDNEEDTSNVKGVIMQLIGWMPELLNVFTSPNEQLKQKGIASQFITGKSWIRLMNTNACKIGGGSRVKSIELNDQWNVMTGNTDNAIYQQAYGQTYSYTDINGKSSGVATYEPLGCKENPFIKPFYDKNKRDLLLGPDTDNYVEEPLGESFFPSPKVTYSRVTVANLQRQKTENNVNKVVKKHATGSVVTEFYTSKDFPTIANRTPLASNFDTSSALAGLLNLNVKNHITLSQGFSIHTNDMDGKMKNQRVYGEGQNSPISGVDYNYNTVTDIQNSNEGKLNNTIQTIDSKGAISEKLVGVDYDVINDFRESTTTTTTAGINFNLATLPITIFVIVVPTIIPSYSKHEDQIRTAVTTKVIHSTGILSEKIAYDSGAKVSTKNLAWDANTGEVLLTQTTNEYKDNYFSFNFPAYWSYDGMSQAAINADLITDIIKSGDDYKFKEAANKASDYLINGDEVWLSGTNSNKEKKDQRAWIVKLADSNFNLLDINGKLIRDVDVNGKIKIIRSGHRNMQTASMASVTSMRNPLYNYDTNNKITTIKSNIGGNPFESANIGNRIVNASAVEYYDVWPSQCECNLPKMTFANGALQFEYEKTTTSDDDAESNNFYNPYLYNILGNWRANKSYAYLTGRNYTTEATPRKTGFFADFFPFYVMSNDKWGISKDNSKKWTYASEVTQYNPYGQEVENKDALNRYSSAIYGYNNRFPVAVASNTKYNELASDGFEDYDSNEVCTKASHFDYKAQLKQNDISISSTQSHTGRKSLKVAPNKKAIVKKQVIPCATN
jgi:hypothetical protein